MRLAILALALVACGSDPWKMKDAPKRPPDLQFRTGTEAVCDVYVWKCEAGSRIAIGKNGTAFMTSNPTMEKGPCGTPLPLELTPCPGNPYPHQIPDGCRWPGSPPKGHDFDGLDAGPP